MGIISVYGVGAHRRAQFSGFHIVFPFYSRCESPKPIRAGPEPADIVAQVTFSFFSVNLLGDTDLVRDHNDPLVVDHIGVAGNESERGPVGRG